ncbi:MAG: gephyrin-like molybdotransferase Glp [Pseudomonadota bacterium]
MSRRALLDDCFLHDKDRLRHDQALEILRDGLKPITGSETVALVDALGRVAAHAVTAPRLVPASDNAAVDGWAFCHADYASRSGRLSVYGRSAAGHPLERAVPPGSAARIFTGAVMPGGTDTIAMQEDVTVDGDTIAVPAGLKPGANRRRAGEDLAEGAEVIAARRRLTPADIAAIASTGADKVQVHTPLSVAVASTGDEIVAPGSALLGPAQVYDANRPLLLSLLDGLPACITDGGLIRDDADTVRATLQDLAERHDVLITTGGASLGEADHLVETLDELGTRKAWQLAIKPGRPMMIGRIGDCAVFGLPGNPVAAFVCFLLYVRPALIVLAGGAWQEPQRYPLPAGFDMTKKPDRREFLRGILRETEQGLVVDKFARDGSGLITGLREADGLIEISEDVTMVSKNDTISFVPFGSFGLDA